MFADVQTFNLSLHYQITKRGAKLYNGRINNMIKQVLFFNNQIVGQQQTLTLTLTVEVTMIQSVIELSECNRWTIKCIGAHVLSNAMRNCATMTVTCPAWFIQRIMDNLNIGHLDTTNVEYFRTALQKQRVNYTEPVFIKYDRVNHTWSFKRNSPVVVKQQYITPTAVWRRIK